MTSVEKPATAITAAQIEKGELGDLGAQVVAHLEKMRAYEAKAEEKAGHELRKAGDHSTSVTQLLAVAKAKCSGGGFKAFKKMYCPDLGRSRIYELLSIGRGKVTLEESRAKKRASVAKSRSKKVSATSPVADSAVTPPVPYQPGIYLLNDTRHTLAELESSLKPEPTVADVTPPPPPKPTPVAEQPSSPPPAPPAPAKPQDVGPYSRAETDRLRSRVAELGDENRRLQIENVGLKNEVSELETVNRELRARIAELVEKSPASAAPPPITVNQKAEADNVSPDASAVSPPSDDLDVRTFMGGVLAAVTGKRR